MLLTSGSRLGAYEILGSLGAGGMGEVYRARDNRLRREVAIKVLPAVFAADPDRLARFEQEARAAAALNHPNILAVHDVGQHDGALFIVTELLEGMALRETLHSGPVPPRKAVAYGAAIAQGLAAAHDKGIVHRDLKPDNVFITTDNRVKILDFGVAKLTQPEALSQHLTVAPTAAEGATPATAAGMVIGTVGYMSPEQVRGGVADARSDIFSLGVVLHEMLSGKRPFSGETPADIMSAILKDDPADLPVDQRRIPPALARIIGRCLEKAPAARFQSARDLAFALEALTAPTDAASSAAEARDMETGRRTPGGRAVPLATAALVAVIAGLLAAGAAWTLKPAPADQASVVKLSVNFPEGDAIDFAQGPELDISRDGQSVVFAATHGGVMQLMLRRLDSTSWQVLPGTNEAYGPFFSPDGSSIGFFARGRLRTITIASLETRELADTPVGRGGWWADDGFIYYAPGNTSGVMKVASSGGTAVTVTTLDRAKGEVSHRWPQVLPNGKAMLVTVWTGPARDNKTVQVVRFDSGARETIAVGGDTGRYVRSGHVLFGRLDALMALPFDVERLAPTGTAFQTGVSVRIGQEGASYAVSRAGDLLHIPGDERRLDTRLVWVDRSGRVEPVALPPQDIANTKLSPDGRRAAFNMHGATFEIGIFDFERGSLTPLTNNTTGTQAPVWSPDGRRIAFRGTRNGYRNVWIKSVDGTTDEQQLTRGDRLQTPMSWSPDGMYLLYYETDPVRANDIWILSLADGKTQPLVTAPLSQHDGQWSPDGRWIAYTSEESGGEEVYVLPFPLTGDRWRVSTSGGADPLWSEDGRELFYRTGGKVMAVEIRTSPRFSAGAPRELFADSFAVSPNFMTGYSVAADGRFLFAQPVRPDPPTRAVQMVLNWFSELRRADPGK
jgi:Tol biopolymer transport system component/tRNA A-37 threonylcarbamoyl transferase component Bud32